MSGAIVYLVMRRTSCGEDCEVLDVVSNAVSAELLASNAIGGPPAVKVLGRNGVVEWEVDGMIQWIDARVVGE